MNNESIVSNKTLSATQFREMFRPFIYGWSRKGVYLYIGMTLNGLKRIFTHDIIDTVEPIQEEDYFDFWYRDDPTTLKQLEKKLIEWHKPKYNSKDNPNYTARVRGPSLKNQCLACGELFPRPKFDPSQNKCWKCRHNHMKVNPKFALLKRIEARKKD